MQFFPLSTAGQGLTVELKAATPVRKVFLSSGASGWNERWCLEVWDEGVLHYGSLSITALGAPSLTAAGSALHNQPTEGWGFHTPALGFLGLKTHQGKTKFQLFYSPFLCIL